MFWDFPLLFDCYFYVKITLNSHLDYISRIWSVWWEPIEPKNFQTCSVGVEWNRIETQSAWSIVALNLCTILFWFQKNLSVAPFIKKLLCLEYSIGQKWNNILFAQSLTSSMLQFCGSQQYSHFSCRHCNKYLTWLLKRNVYSHMWEEAIFI